MGNNMDLNKLSDEELIAYVENLKKVKLQPEPEPKPAKKVKSPDESPYTVKK